ncbi:MAG: hypothetical protein ABIH26_09250 [Candidatus Eisenbacteria bacterium]
MDLSVERIAPGYLPGALLSWIAFVVVLSCLMGTVSEGWNQAHMPAPNLPRAALRVVAGTLIGACIAWVYASLLPILEVVARFLVHQCGGAFHDADTVRRERTADFWLFVVTVFQQAPFYAAVFVKKPVVSLFVGVLGGMAGGSYVFGKVEEERMRWGRDNPGSPK